MTNSDETNGGLSAKDASKAEANETSLSVHDTFFYKIMSDPAQAGAELRCVLPRKIVQVMRWDTLRVEPHRFADGNLGNHFADLLLSIRVRQRKTYIHILFEHSSGPKVHELLQALRYQLRFWEQEKSSRKGQEQDPRRLTPILTVIFHHSETGWKGKLRFADYLDLDPDLRPIFQPYLVDFGVFVDDISRVDPDVLLSRPVPPAVRIMLFALRLGRTGPRVLDELPKIAEDLTKVWSQPSGKLVIQSFFVYMKLVTKVPEADIRMAVQNTFEPVFHPILGAVFDGDFAKAAELLAAHDLAEAKREARQEGKLEGERKGERKGERRGIVKGKIATLQRILELRFGKLPPAALEQLKTSSLKALETIELRVLTAATLDEVLILPAQRKR